MYYIRNLNRTYFVLIELDQLYIIDVVFLWMHVKYEGNPSKKKLPKCII